MQWTVKVTSVTLHYGSARCNGNAARACVRSTARAQTLCRLDTALIARCGIASQLAGIVARLVPALRPHHICVLRVL